MKSKKEKETKILHAIRRSSISIAGLLVIIFLISVAPNYVKEEKVTKTKLVINNTDVTNSLKNDIIKENGTFYISIDDLRNFFDQYIIDNGDYIITTSDTKTAKINKTSTMTTINGAMTNFSEQVLNENNTYYLPIKKMKNVYDYNYSYSDENDAIMVDSLSRKFVDATSSKNQSVKYAPTIFSKSVDKVKRGDKIVIIQDKDYQNDILINGWVKVRSPIGKIGYMKKSNLINEETVRDNLTQDKIDGKVSIAWDYFSTNESAPSRTGRIDGINVVSPSFYNLNQSGTITKNVGDSGRNYITWAHDNGYKVWPTFSNTFVNGLDDTSKLMQTFETRESLINNIIEAVVSDDVDGISIDFENMYKEDKDKFSRFLIELAPRMQDLNKTLAVIVTAPDGSDTWSLCYDRNTIGKVSDYVIFLGYDQTPASSKVAETTSGYNWQELNIKKMLGQEGIPENKLIVASAFYTRLWKVDSNGNVVKSQVVNMNNVSIPSNASKTWDDLRKQNYIEYKDGSYTYKMWIIDEESISCKLDLINNYKLAGAGFWELDRETAGVWKIISEKLEVK